MKFILLLLGLSPWVFATDLYQNFAELSAVEPRGVTYRITNLRRDTDQTVLAIHAGNIEPGTSELSELVAGNDKNLYRFEGLKSENAFSLHITSAHFDEPQALALTAGSRDCLSIHGFRGEENVSAICVGGGNPRKAQELAGILRDSSLPFSVEYPCVPFPGAHPRNIVNRCQNQGAQVELSTALRKALLQDPRLMRTLALELRKYFQISGP